MDLSEIAIETGKQIFHSKTWDFKVNDEVILELLNLARINVNGKARLCLHPNSDEIMQVTYLAFVAPYEDKIHCHPHRPEVLIPIRGKAETRTFDDSGNVLTTDLMIGGSGSAFSTEKLKWHSLKLITYEFVMVEIGIGPLISNSTTYIDEIWR
jgi:cupin fold WbuC family metalloprotein